jgi:protein O-GlcNAc transferase
MPDASELLHQALALHQRGELDAAARAYAVLLDIDAHNVAALSMYGVLRQQHGDIAGALQLLDRAVALAPQQPGVLSNRAAVHLAAGDFKSAQRDADAATRVDPRMAGAWLNLGLALDGAGSIEDAARAFRRGAALRADDARLLLEWFSAAARSQQPVGLADRSQRPPPPLARERGRALRTAGELARFGYSNQALYLLSQLRSELPADAQVAHAFAIEAEYRRALQLELQGDIDAALCIGDALLEVAPDHRGARLLRAGLLGARGEASEASAAYRDIVAGVPDDAIAGDAYLIALQYDPRVDAESLAQAHVDWAARHTREVAPRWRPLDATPDRPLRIGWLSPRFVSGLVETFFLPVLAAFDRTAGWHMLYESGGIADAATDQLRRAADAHRDVSDLDDAELAQAIRDDRIDVLVELSGHGPGNRLRALARRPAPLQVSWLDYFHSTGMPAIDVLLSDAVLSPPASLHRYSERVLTLPSGRLCYAPQAELPHVVSRETNAPLRFGCFNRVEKINDDVLALWARVLDGAPRSTLRLKARLFDTAGEREHFLARAARAGIAAQRLELTGYSALRDVLAAYADIDIALDTFPFSGCATSCDALWMGVPVVTLCGAAMAARQTASLLTTLRLPELIAHTPDDYVRIAQALATDTERRAALRGSLRACMGERLGNVARHARELEAALREAWRACCSA